tara:strand:+ start:879 stop:2303 length:1425 start_codon:yes stop_codon:yes gene_type:complete
MALINQTQQDYYNNEDFGGYQFTSLKDIVNQFIVAYVGEDKLISKIKRIDVAYHAQRALQELSFDVFKSCKSIETEVKPSLTMPLPQDYVNYTKISSVDSSGIKHILYPTLSKTSNPKKYQTDANGDFLFGKDTNYSNNIESLLPSGNLIKNGNFQGGSGAWNLNVGFDGQAQSTPTPVGSGLALSAAGLNLSGWYYEDNSIKGYALPQSQAFRQDSVDIIHGEQYTITYTISSYATGSYNFVIVDENGIPTLTTTRSANGTYTETITADGLNANYSIVNNATGYVPSSVYLECTTDNTSVLGLNVIIDNISIVRVGDEETSNTWKNYKSHKPSENNINDYQDYQNDIYWPNEGRRFGLDPQHAQVNGSYYIDCNSGKIYFSSNLSGKTVILDYISDSLGTDEEMKVHKFAEEAMYKCIAYAILSVKPGVPEYVIRRYKKERFAETRKAKLRLSNIKLEEITQIFRGKSKQIKH